MLYLRPDSDSVGLFQCALAKITNLTNIINAYLQIKGHLEKGTGPEGQNNRKYRQAILIGENL